MCRGSRRVLSHPPPSKTPPHTHTHTHWNHSINNDSPVFCLGLTTRCKPPPPPTPPPFSPPSLIALTLTILHSHPLPPPTPPWHSQCCSCHRFEATAAGLRFHPGWNQDFSTNYERVKCQLCGIHQTRDWSTPHSILKLQLMITFIMYWPAGCFLH